LKQISSPFGCLLRDITRIDKRISADEIKEQLEEEHGDHPYAKAEKQMEKNFDIKAAEVAKKYGYETVPWLELTKVVLFIYSVLTILSMYYRPESMSITVCALGIYSVECPNYVKRSLFRCLVIFTALTMVFDFIHLFIMHSSEEDDLQDCEMTANVRRFAYLFAWLSFFFRPIVICVLWKDSLDFFKIIKQRNESDLEMLSVLNKYGFMKQSTI